MAPSTLYSETTVGPLAITLSLLRTFPSSPCVSSVIGGSVHMSASKMCRARPHFRALLSWIHLRRDTHWFGGGRQAQSTALRGNVEPQRRW